MTIAPTLLASAGRCLHGERWQQGLARDLDVLRQTVQKWTTGEYPPPPEAWSRLEALLEARGDEARDCRRRIARYRVASTRQ